MQLDFLKLHELLKSTKKSNKKKLYVLKEEEFNILNSYLIVHDKNYQKLVSENMNILSKQVNLLKTYKENSSYLGTYTSKLRGNILANGLLYINGIKNPFPWLNIYKKFYPKKFKGKIDWRGHINITVMEKGFSFIGSRIPQRFKMKFNQNGDVLAKMDKHDFEFSGTSYIDKLICDPFSNSENDKNKFLENRFILLKKLQAIKKQWLNK
jgi:hypothetical protein